MDTGEPRHSLFVGRRTREILEHGTSARAALVEVRELGMRRGGARRASLTLEVEPNEAPPFRVTKQVLVLRPELPVAGERYWVRFDPADLSRVEFDELRCVHWNASATAPANGRPEGDAHAVGHGGTSRAPGDR